MVVRLPGPVPSVDVAAVQEELATRTFPMILACPGTRRYYTSEGAALASTPLGSTLPLCEFTDFDVPTAVICLESLVSHYGGRRFEVTRRADVTSHGEYLEFTSPRVTFTEFCAGASDLSR